MKSLAWVGGKAFTYKTVRAHGVDLCRESVHSGIIQPNTFRSIVQSMVQSMVQSTVHGPGFEVSQFLPSLYIAQSYCAGVRSVWVVATSYHTIGRSSLMTGDRDSERDGRRREIKRVEQWDRKTGRCIREWWTWGDVVADIPSQKSSALGA